MVCVAKAMVKERLAVPGTTVTLVMAMRAPPGDSRVTLAGANVEGKTAWLNLTWIEESADELLEVALTIEVGVGAVDVDVGILNCTWEATIGLPKTSLALAPM